MSEAVERALEALRAGKPVVLPTDTVYGLCADAYREEPVRRLARLKGRPEGQPIALLAADLDAMLDAVPELRGRAAVAARALLPGPYTLVLPNPARRFRWLTGARPETIGVRVPDLPPECRAVVERVGVVAATSANAHGEPDARRLDDVPEEIRAQAGALVDGGELPGTPSTVVDLTGPEPVDPAGGCGARRRGAQRDCEGTGSSSGLKTETASEYAAIVTTIVVTHWSDGRPASGIEARCPTPSAGNSVPAASSAPGTLRPHSRRNSQVLAHERDEDGDPDDPERHDSKGDGDHGFHVPLTRRP